jgi:hypothetical protein
MTDKKDNFIEFGEELDPSVDAFLSTEAERRAIQKLPPQERKKKAKERERIRDRKARRVTYDLPPDLRSQVAEIAKKKGVPASQLAAWLITRALEQHGGSAEELDEELTPYLESSQSPKFTWNLHRYLFKDSETE